VKPIGILDRKVKVQNKKSIWMVNVQRTYYGLEYDTWEDEENMWEEYLQIFDNFQENKMQDSILSNQSFGTTSQSPIQLRWGP
jgi:hypothetical protein